MFVAFVVVLTALSLWPCFFFVGQRLYRKLHDCELYRLSSCVAYGSAKFVDRMGLVELIGTGHWLSIAFL